MQTQFNPHELLTALELPLNALDGIQKAKSIPTVQRELKDFKQVVKQQRRVLAKRYHPDKGVDAERMKEINNICDWVLGSEITPIPIQPVVRYYSYSYFSGTTASSTETTFYYS